MKRFFVCCFLFAALLVWGSQKLYAQSSSQSSTASIKKTFLNIPSTQQTGVYWYWMADNLSKEGVIKDLQAMKEQGINRAYIGFVTQNIPYGKVKMFTDEWWDILHAALKTASELDIEIGIFNSPGWSQSGGPWVKPSQAMRYLASNQTLVTGPKRFQAKLPAVGEDAQDVKVLAYPYVAQTCSFVPQQDLHHASVIDLVSKKPETVRTLTIQMIHKKVKTPAELLVKVDGAYRSLCKFNIDRSNVYINVGFDRYAPIVISLPECKASEFRLIIDKDKAGSIESVNLSDVPQIERYPEKTFAKMYPGTQPLFYDHMWRQEPENTSTTSAVLIDKVIDITHNLASDGTLSWNVPKGQWAIMRTAMVPTGQTNTPAPPEGRGLEVDKMSKEHIASHFESFIGQILKRIPEADRKTFRIVVADSYETGGQNWTDSMAVDFVRQYGYDPIPYLPVFKGVVVGSKEQSDRFLWDLRRLVADKIAYDYVGGLKKVSNEHGLTTWLENYGHWGFPAEFLQYGGQSDEVAGEFWSTGTLGNIENRAASSCGHIYGKQKIWAESFTCGGPDFSRYPGEMKQRGDRFFTEGINSTLLHVCISQPDDRIPGINAPFGNEFNRHNTWFSQLHFFTQYLKRCNMMLQQGRYIADVAYFIGEDAPKMTGVRTPEIPKGYSFDYINAEVLMKYAKMQDGLLTLNSGMQYRVLVLPQIQTMRPEFLEKLKELIKEGLVVLGPAPNRSPSLQNYPQADEQVRALASELWQTAHGFPLRVCDYGKGKIYTNASLEEIFADMNVVPDFQVSDYSLPVLFIHRALQDGNQLYFISNQSDKNIAFDASFRVKNMRPELWNPQLAEVRQLPEYKHQAQTTEVPIELKAYESAFIVFSPDSENVSTEGKNYPSGTLLKTISEPWKVSFEAKRGGPARPVVFSSLTDWTQNSNDSIKYFSGTATYATSFKLDKRPVGSVYLKLGEVMVMAKVKLNGQEVGGVWTYPYEVNISNALKSGTNTLEIEVVNDWQNRIIRDKSLPESNRLTWQPVTSWKADSPLQSSGLLGPVTLVSYPYTLNP